jgi:hypothetical protein
LSKLATSIELSRYGVRNFDKAFEDSAAGMEKESKRTTIYDLAKLADASPSAVSSVLNGTWEKRRISRKLAERVTRLADE